ncbi:MAG: hydrogenase maturation protease [Anaerolineales bacterium]|jgi:hydrogenase maturation protease
MERKRTIVIGLGNPILTDDGVGVLVARLVEKRVNLDNNPWLTITEASAGGMRLMERTLDYQRVVLIDAYYLDPTATTPGKIHQLTLEDLRTGAPTQHSTSAHDTSLVTALDAARQLGYSVPEEFSIYAVEVENILEFGEEPTPRVAEAIPQVAELVLDDLGVSE